MPVTKKQLLQVQEMMALKLLSILTKWWILQTHVENCRWSQVLVKFYVINVVLGNQDTYRAADWICQDGRAFFSAHNDEIQLIIKVESMEQARIKAQTSEREQSLRNLYETQDWKQRWFLGVQKLLGSE